MNRLVAAALMCFACASSFAQTAGKIVFYTNWFAEAEHGGFYQAQAEGLYRQAGLDVEIRMGGPQVNGLQLLAAGRMDVFMGYDFQTLPALEQGLPLVTIAATFQKVRERRYRVMASSNEVSCSEGSGGSCRDCGARAPCAPPERPLYYSPPTGGAEYSWSSICGPAEQ